MAMERQTSWGGVVASYMFLGGTGAGIYTAGFMLGLMGNLKLLALTSMVLGPTLVVLGLILLLLHAGSPIKAYGLLRGLSTSWLSRGGLIQLLFIILGLVYTLPGFWLSGWLSSGGGIVIGVIYAGIDELHQIPIPNRLGTWQDFVADSLGVGIGIYAAVRYFGRKIKRA